MLFNHLENRELFTRNKNACASRIHYYGHRCQVCVLINNSVFRSLAAALFPLAATITTCSLHVASSRRLLPLK